MSFVRVIYLLDVFAVFEQNSAQPRQRAFSCNESLLDARLSAGICGRGESLTL